MNTTIKIFFLILLSHHLIAQDGYELVWSDEFDVQGLPDTEKWSYDIGDGCPDVCGWGNNELEYYTKDRLENARVEGGNLIITAIKETYEGKEYTSARLVTRDKGDWTFGRIEVRAKLPSGTGTWPAIWMLPTDWVYGGWPDSGEIDIMEHVGHEAQKIYGTVHTEAFNHGIGTQKGGEIVIADCESAFHTYRIEWSFSKIDFYVDDQKYFSFAKQSGSDKWPFDQRFHLLLNIAVGGNWGGAQGVDDTIFPQEMIVDYVRVYKLITDVKKVPGSGQLQIFPNPGRDNYFTIKKATLHQDQVRIFDMSGRSIAHQMWQDEEYIHVALQDKHDRVLWVEVNDGNGNRSGGKYYTK